MTSDHRFVDSLGNVAEGPEQVQAGWASYFRMVPNYSIVVDETYSNGPVAVMLGLAQGTYVHPIDKAPSIHPNEQRSLAGDPDSTATPKNAPGGDLKPENHWQTPLAIRAFIEDGLVAEWRVYADNEPRRQLMRATG